MQTRPDDPKGDPGTSPSPGEVAALAGQLPPAAPAQRAANKPENPTAAKFLSESMGESDDRMQRFVAQAVNSPRSTESLMAEMAVSPSLNAGAVVDSFSVFRGLSELNEVADSVRQVAKKVQEGDLSSMEAMLVSQATALQTLFTSLALKAQAQVQSRTHESILNLALKAQAQSRATISTLVELKYPRQATFVKQANIANGPQQVNNSTPAAISEGAPIKLLAEGGADGSTHLDLGATSTAARGDPAMAALGQVDRPQKRQGQADRGSQRDAPRRPIG